MGEHLTVAIVITLVCTLLVLPQLIDWTIGRKAPPLTGAAPGHNAEPRAAFEKRHHKPNSRNKGA
jgi:hypothetical protein